MKGGPRPGSGRKPAPKRVRLNTTVLPSTLAEIDRLAGDGPRGPVVDAAVVATKRADPLTALLREATGRVWIWSPTWWGYVSGPYLLADHDSGAWRLCRLRDGHPLADWIAPRLTEPAHAFAVRVAEEVALLTTTTKEPPKGGEE